MIALFLGVVLLLLVFFPMSYVYLIYDKALNTDQFFIYGFITVVMILFFTWCALKLVGL